MSEIKKITPDWEPHDELEKDVKKFLDGLGSRHLPYHIMNI